MTPLSTLLLATTLAITTTTVYATPTPFHNPEPQGPQGVDIGNIFCMGPCVADPDALPCSGVMFQPTLGCYMCCLSDAESGFDLELD